MGLGVSVLLAVAGDVGAVANPGAAEQGPSPVGAAVPFCGPGSSCQQVWSSPYGRVAGVGLAGWGVVAYAALAAGGAAWLRRAEGAAPALQAGVVALAWAVAGFSAYLIALQWGVLRTFCPWCVVADTAGIAGALAFTVAARHGAALRAGATPGQGLRMRPGPGARGPRSRMEPAGRRDRWQGAAVPAGAGLVLAAVLAFAHWAGAGGWSALAERDRLAAGPGSFSIPNTLGELEAMMAAGPADAPVRLDIYSDFQCPYCARAAEQVVVPLLATDVAEGRMRLVFHNFAILGAESQWAARAAVCAAVQGSFWPYHDRLFAEQRGENVGTYRLERLVALAQEEGLDAEAFRRCLNARATAQLVEASYEQGRSLGVRATPTFLVNGRRVEGLVPLEYLRQAAYAASP